jgi:hypothetical protein
MLDGLIVERDPPSKRRSKCLGEKEQHLPEAAVMLAYAVHLLRTMPGLDRVEIHPDGEHGKGFHIARWLSEHGFEMREKRGSTSYGGTYVRDQQVIVVDPKSGEGDVVANTQQVKLLAECKGGVVNSSHAGQTSRLRKGLCEAIGQLMQKPKGGTQAAVVPHTNVTLRLAKAIASRAHDAGIVIALVDAKGRVTEL